jgi:Fe2+ transport system protein FeoA
MSEEKKIKDLTRSGIEDRKTDKKLFPVTSLKEDEEGVIHSISGGLSLISRLAGMGIVPGTEIKVLRNSRGPVIVLVNNTRVALGRGQASKILVAFDLSRQEEGQIVE